MARFRKCVVDNGLYETPLGPQVVDPARIRHWDETVRGMIAAGHKPPLSWGHVASALPHPPDHAFWKSRYNAGEVTGSSVDDKGRWWLEGDAPGVEMDAEGRFVTEAVLPDGLRVKAALGEVSVGAMDWTDGSGKLWTDAPVHLALTPLPVWIPPGGQPGFVRADAPKEPEGEPSGVAQFGTRTLLARLSTMDFPPKKDDDKPDKPADPAKPVEPPKPPETPAPGAAPIGAIVNALRGIGINLPYNVADFDALLIALETIAATKPAGGPMNAPNANPPAPTPQEPGAFLSTIQDPLTRGLVAKALESDRAARLARIEALGKRGLPVHAAQKLRQQASQAHFAVGANGALAAHPVDETLGLLEASLPQGQEFSRTYLSTVAAEPPPEETGARQAEETKRKKQVDDLARRNNLPPRPAAKAS